MLILLYFGAIAQLGECLHGMQEVVGSNPIGSILFTSVVYRRLNGSFACFTGHLDGLDVRLARPGLDEISAIVKKWLWFTRCPSFESEDRRNNNLMYLTLCMHFLLAQ